MKDIHTLIALKSAVELNRFKSLNFFFSELSDKNLVRKIISEINRRNFGNISTLIDKYLYDNFKNTVFYQEKDIKQFDLEQINDCKISKIKEVLGITQFEFNTLKNINGEGTDFFKHWDNLNRFAVISKKELIEEIKKDNQISLDFTKELVIAKLGYYTKFTIEKHNPNKSNLDESGHNEFYERQTFEDYNGSHAQDYAGYSDQEIDSIFEGDADNYWNID
ncbi:hypothetical protein [Polaribacter sp. 11A2H]|uniref:hypothetical protein n=1 Tax=Polaribacter sp. 11A2H TaxID=2687290 RepID=UPI001407F8E0|nr:hypothetical protein [Polaribacter sp. 11A2H]